jgi:hypothetical protein
MPDTTRTFICEYLSLIGSTRNRPRLFLLNDQLTKSLKFVFEGVLNVDDLADLTSGECVDNRLILHTYGHFVCFVVQFNLGLKLVSRFWIGF